MSQSPVQVVIGRNLTTLSSTTVTILCPSSGLPAPTVTWTLHGRPLSFGGTIFGNSTMMVIYNAGASDTGRYTCRAHNIKGDDSATSFVEVLGK